LMPTCAGLLEPKESRLGLLKSAFNAENFICAGCRGLSPAIMSQFTVEMRDAANNCEKLTKNPYFRGSKSFKVIDADKSIKLVTSSTSIPICNRFHTI